MPEDSKKEKKKKMATAQKRMIQDKKKRMANRSFKSRVRRTIRFFETALSSGEKENVTHSLRTVYSLMDKGIKKGIYKKNKAARVKSHLTLKAAKHH